MQKIEATVPETTDPRPFMNHMLLAKAFLRGNGKKATELQVAKVMNRFSLEELEQMVAKNENKKLARHPEEISGELRSRLKSYFVGYGARSKLFELIDELEESLSCRK
jgi:hypothetical protein